MNLKICSKCGKEKPLKDFYLRKSGPRSGKYYEKCKECMKLRGRNYYHLNHKRQLNLALIRRAKYRKIMRDFLIKVKSGPCVDCGGIYPPFVMDFDHRDGEKKEKEIARMVASGWSKIKVENEIKKCELVCSNCHRIRTYQRSHAGIAKVVTAEL